MHRLSPMRLFAVVLIAGTSLTAVAAQSAFAFEPVAIAQTTSAISSKAFLGTPAPDVLSAPASPSLVAGSSASLAPIHSGVLSPVVGAGLLILLVLAAGLVLLSRRRRARRAMGA